MKVAILFVILIMTSLVYAQVPQEIEMFDIMYYMPQKLSVGDLVYDVEIEDLKKQINEKKSIGEIKDLYFRAYWEPINGHDVEVLGLPQGFKELKASLIKMVLSRVDYVIPVSIKDQLKGLQIKKNEDNSFSATDPSGKSYISEINLKFDDKKILKSVSLLSPAGIRTSTYSFSTKPWSKNKIVLDKVEMLIKEGVQENSIIGMIDYQLIDGIGFPKTITIESEVKINQKLSQDSESMKEKVVYKLSNYQINTGKAKQHHRKGK